MKTAEEIAALRNKMIEHLEAALAIADETKDGTSGFLIEQALMPLARTCGQQILIGRRERGNLDGGNHAFVAAFTLLGVRGEFHLQRALS